MKNRSKHPYQLIMINYVVINHETQLVWMLLPFAVAKTWLIWFLSHFPQALTGKLLAPQFDDVRWDFLSHFVFNLSPLVWEHLREPFTSIQGSRVRVLSFLLLALCVPHSSEGLLIWRAPPSYLVSTSTIFIKFLPCPANIGVIKA